MDAATKRMADVLDKLPKEITPVNLEELRRVKQALVELESKADQLRCDSALNIDLRLLLAICRLHLVSGKSHHTACKKVAIVVFKCFHLHRA